MKISIKNGSSAEWEMFGKIRPRLGIIFYDLVDFLGDQIDELIITSIIRPKTNDSGIHALGRAIDISGRGIDRFLGEAIEEYLNKKYIYHKARPDLKTIIRHTTSNAGDPGDHFHIQVGE